MDKRKYKKSDKDVRSALWLAYDKKDVYSGDLLRYREMEVDHIIPQEIFKNEKQKLEILNLLGLDSNFEKDSLENFVPTRRELNSSKGDNIDIILIRNTLNKAQRMKGKIEKLIKEYNEECDFVNVTTKVAVLANDEEKRQEVADIIFDEDEEFENEELLIEYQFIKSIRMVELLEETEALVKLVDKSERQVQLLQGEISELKKSLKQISRRQPRNKGYSK